MAKGSSNAVLRYVHKVAFLLERGQMTDGQLLGRFLGQRDESAFEALMHRHGPMVLGVCHRLLADPHDAEDAFQATFLVLVRKAGSIKNRELVGNWLYGAALRAALEAKTTRRRSRERQVIPMPEPAAPTAEICEDLGPLLDQELSQLPEKFRVPVVLCDLEGRTRREVARQLGIPDGTLSGRLTTGRRRLAQRLTRRGVVLSGAGLVAALSESSVAASVPAALAVSTVQAVTAAAAGQTAASLVSAKVAALAEGVVKTMLLTKLKALSFVLLSATLFGSGGTLLTYHALGAGQTTARQGIPTQAVAVNETQTKPVQEKKDESPKPENKNYGFLGVILAEDGDPKQVIGHEVFPDSPAAKAGLQAGDVLFRIGDTRVTEANEAAKILKSSKPGDKVTIGFKRAGREMRADITLGTWPAEAKEEVKGEEENAAGYLGLILRDDGDNDRVVVHEIAPDSPATKAGLKPDDILLKVGEAPVKNAGDVIKELGKLKVGDKVKLRIKRGDKEMDVTVTAAKRPADFGKM
jgi:RNA polymerase sigma factor (sigma-70 family)